MGSELEDLGRELLESQVEGDHEHPQDQVDRLAAFILAEVDGEPSQSEGAIDTAIRVIRRQAAALRSVRNFASVCRQNAQHAVDVVEHDA